MGSKSVLAALAYSYLPQEESSYDSKLKNSWTASVSAAYSQRPIYEDLVNSLSEHVGKSIHEMTHSILESTIPKPGIPVQTMSGYPVSTSFEVSIEFFCHIFLPKR